MKYSCLLISPKFCAAYGHSCNTRSKSHTFEYKSFQAFLRHLAFSHRCRRKEAGTYPRTVKGSVHRKHEEIWAFFLRSPKVQKIQRNQEGKTIRVGSCYRARRSFVTSSVTSSSETEIDESDRCLQRLNL